MVLHYTVRLEAAVLCAEDESSSNTIMYPPTMVVFKIFDILTKYFAIWHIFGLASSDKCELKLENLYRLLVGSTS